MTHNHLQVGDSMPAIPRVGSTLEYGASGRGALDPRLVPREPGHRDQGLGDLRVAADAFLVMRSTWADDSTQEFVFGRNDARDEFVAFAHDDRGVYRVFAMTFADGEWTLLRQDPDFHQRIVMRVQPDRIDLRADASEDAGQTWRKDLDYIFTPASGR